MSETPQEPEHKIILKDRPAKAGSPAIWLVLLSIPLVLGLLISLYKGNSEEPIPEPPELKPVTGRVAGTVSASNPIIANAITTEQESIGLQEIPVCDFEPWIGLKVEDDMLDALKGAKRPFRVLPPGSMMTMDHSPARVNFDTDEAGTITRVWCG